MQRVRAEIRREGRLRVGALLVSALVGVGAVAGRALSPPQRFVFDVAGPADDAFGPVRADFAPGEHVGILVPGRNDLEDQILLFTSQYALAPAIVEPVRLSACTRSVVDPDCRVDRVESVAAVDLSPASVSLVAERLGLVQRHSTDLVAVLRRPVR